MKPGLSSQEREILNYIYWLFIIIVPIVAFFVLLSLNLPLLLMNIIRDQSVFAFFIILGLYLLCFRLKGKARWFFCLLLTVILFAVPLAYMWNTGYSDTRVIGSFIPYKDSYYFYNGARTLLMGQSISAGWNDILRPLFPGMLAGLLFFTSNNLLLTISLFVLAMGICCLLAALQVEEIFGKWPAALFMALMVLYFRSFIGYTMSEPPSIIQGIV